MAAGANYATRLTPAGSGAIAVVRIAGPAVGRFLQHHFSAAAKLNRCVHGELRDSEGLTIDDIVAVMISDDAADLNLHGGPWVIEATLALLRREGFDVLDQPPLEAFDGQDMLEREMLAHVSSAKTEAGLRMLLAQPAAWRKLTNPSPKELKATAQDQCLWRLLHPARVAIVGIPNVGKSTLANQLFGQQRSITADVPGTTRDWIGELADIDGVPVVLVDTPGHRDSSDVIEQSAIGLSQGLIASADLVVIVLDASQPIQIQQPIVERFDHPLVVLNKADVATPPIAHDISTIATTAVGIAKLRTLIRRRLGCEDLTPGRPRWWTQRQRELLERGMTPV